MPNSPARPQGRAGERVEVGFPSPWTGEGSLLAGAAGLHRGAHLLRDLVLGLLIGLDVLALGEVRQVLVGDLGVQQLPRDAVDLLRGELVAVPAVVEDLLDPGAQLTLTRTLRPSGAF